MKDIFNSVNIYYKKALIISLLAFFISTFFYIIMYVIQHGGKNNTLFTIAIISEMIFIVLGERSKSIYKKKQYNEKDVINIPPEDSHHQQIRYLKFRKKIKKYETDNKKKVDNDKIESIFHLISAREEMEKYSNLYAKRFAGAVITLFIGLIISIFRNAEIEISGSIKFFIIFTIIAFFVYQIASLIPSPIEKIKELKYFLELYKYENN